VATQRTQSEDLIGIFEALYDAEQEREAWLRRILARAANGFGKGLGVGGVLYQLVGESGLRLDAIDAFGAPEGWVDVGREMHCEPLMLRDIAHAYRTLTCGSGRAFLRPTESGHRVFDSWQRFGVGDVLVLNGINPLGLGYAMHVFLPERVRFAAAQLEALRRLACHMAIARRLQQRVAELKDVTQTGVEAILSARGRLEHAEPVAQSTEARRSLSVAVVRREWARGRARREHPDEAVRAWHGLVACRWTLIDHFEKGGKRYILARENAPACSGPTALSARERQIVALAALGRSNKLIAYELGLAHATVRVLMARAGAKLQAHSRPELIERFRDGRQK
jgi:DNA-binding CsgD family transcriptional regulator